MSAVALLALATLGLVALLVAAHRHEPQYGPVEPDWMRPPPEPAVDLFGLASLVGIAAGICWIALLALVFVSPLLVLAWLL